MRLALHDEPDQIRLELGAEGGGHAAAPEQRGIGRRIHAEGAEPRGGRQRAHPIHHGQGEPRGRVHWQVEGHDLGVTDRLFVEALARQIPGHDLGAGPAEPRGRRRQAEGLPTELVGRDQDDAHRPDCVTPSRGRREPLW